MRYNTEVFKLKATNAHGETYDYSISECSGSLHKVTIICKTHGVFMQRAFEHCAGNGCPICAGINNGLRGVELLSKAARASATKAADTFIDKALVVHGSTYDYSKSVYGKNNTVKVVITCSKHGDFLQTPGHHLSGKGCPACALDRSNIAQRMSEKNTTPTKLYYVYFPEVALWKIGCTSRTLEDRFRQEKLQYEILLVKEYTSGSEAYTIEKYLLDSTKEFQFTGKVLDVKGNTELRVQPIENLNYLISKAERLYNSVEEDYIYH